MVPSVGINAGLGTWRSQAKLIKNTYQHCLTDRILLEDVPTDPAQCRPEPSCHGSFKDIAMTLGQIQRPSIGKYY